MPQVQCRKSYTPTSQPWRARHNTGHQYSPLLLILSLRGIELYFLTQVTSEIWRDRQTPEVLAKLQTSQGFETQKTSEVGTEEDVKTNAKTRCQLVVETGTKFVHVFVTLNLLLSLTTHLVYYYLINWRIRRKKKINLLIQFIVLDFNLLVIGKSLTRLLLDTLLSFAHFIIRKC